MKRSLAWAAFLVSIQTSSLMVSCGRAEPIAEGTGGSVAWECLTTCMGVTSLAGFDTCAEVEAAYCGSGGSSSGGSGTGGDGGGGACAGTLGMGGECGVCQTSVEEYCEEHDCTMPDLFDPCFDRSPRSTVYTGCGYRQVNQVDGNSTDVPPLVVDIWQEESGELVYHSERSGGDACVPDVVVGEYPTCSGWGLQCDGGYECVRPPHFECFTSCPISITCISEGQSCADVQAACNAGGTGGQGGFGGEAP